MEEQITPKPSGEKSDDLFENKNLYRRRRNDFRGNKDAMTELGHWKARDNNFDYNHLYVFLSRLKQHTRQQLVKNESCQRRNLYYFLPC